MLRVPVTLLVDGVVARRNLRRPRFARRRNNAVGAMRFGIVLVLLSRFAPILLAIVDWLVRIRGSRHRRITLRRLVVEQVGVGVAWVRLRELVQSLFDDRIVRVGTPHGWGCRGGKFVRSLHP